ncbi:MAG: phosphoglycerate kinase [Candidatus Staskawiczbacteria bacterium]|nr:phosphoglycerate kinase [Candidatus Staskawiczbacteria bacterium]
MKTLKDFSVVDKRILVRCDFNVPVDKKGDVLDDFRIKKSLDTIKYLVENKAKIILMSHLDPESTGVADKKYTLDNVAEKLSELLNLPIIKATDCIGPELEGQSNELDHGKILLLENLRFYKEETENNLEFAKKLSYLGDIYVNDAFSVDHRPHASIVGVPQFLPSCAGLLLEKELDSLDKAIKNPEKPMTALIGGAKVETKSNFINEISKVADFVILGGLLAKEVAEKNIEFLHQEKIIVPFGDQGGLDIDDESVKLFSEKILQSKTVLWNGPFGKFEEEKYAKGTLGLANAIIASGAYSVVGGGETVEFLEKRGMLDKFSWVSTGGGAMLAYLSGEKLPGLEALKQ